MKKIIYLALIVLISACTNSTKEPEAPKPENGLDAASKFLRAVLDGDYKTARAYSVNDSTNKQTLDISEFKYNNEMPPDVKRAYKTASIRFPGEPRKINDSVTIIHYSNSHSNQLDSLKVIRTGGQWLIDLNFRFEQKDQIP